MTKQEEIRYLTDLLLQASRWERSEGEVLSGVELEVQDRLRNLLGQPTVDEEGRAQSEPAAPAPAEERDLSAEEAKRERKRLWAAKKYEGSVRVRRDGKIFWAKREHVDRMPIKTGTGFKYIVKPEFEDLYKK